MLKAFPVVTNQRMSPDTANVLLEQKMAQLKTNDLRQIKKKKKKTKISRKMDKSQFYLDSTTVVTETYFLSLMFLYCKI